MSSLHVKEGQTPGALLSVTERLLRTLVEDTSEDARVTDVLTLATKATAQLLNVRACTIRLVEGDVLSVGVAWGYQDPASRAHPIPIDRRLQRLVCEREVLHIGDLDLDPGLPPSRRERMHREGFRSYLGVPMVASGCVEGVLSLYGAMPDEFTGEHIACMRILADCLALRVQQSRRLERAVQGTDTVGPSTLERDVILVVDDHPATAMLLESVLFHEGYQPVVCQTGADALCYLEHHPVSLVITDLQMSDVSGWQVARAAKQRSPQARVLMLTGSLPDVSVECLREYQIDLVLPKPFPLLTLMTAVATLLSK